MRFLAISLLISSLAFLVSCGASSTRERGGNSPLASTGDLVSTENVSEGTEESGTSSSTKSDTEVATEGDTAPVVSTTERGEEVPAKAVNNPSFISSIQEKAILELFPNSNFNQMLANSVAAQASVESVDLKTKMRVTWGRHESVNGSITLQGVDKPIKFHSQYTARILNEEADTSMLNLPYAYWKLDQTRVVQHLPEGRPGDGRVYCLDEGSNSGVLAECNDRAYIVLISERNSRGIGRDPTEDKHAIGVIVVRQKLNGETWNITF